MTPRPIYRRSRRHPSADPRSELADLSRDYSMRSNCTSCVCSKARSSFSPISCAPSRSRPHRLSRVSSYAKGTTSTGEVRLLKDLDAALNGRDVLIVEDIVDTGLTLQYLQEILRARGPRSLRTVCLLNKPSRRKVEVSVDYIGFTIEDRFVVGYGLDFEGGTGACPILASWTSNRGGPALSVESTACPLWMSTLGPSRGRSRPTRQRTGRNPGHFSPILPQPLAVNLALPARHH